MKDGIIRKAIKKIALSFYMIDLKSTREIRRLRDDPLYHLGGSCNQCGACCKSPMIQIFPPFFYLKSIRRLIIMWHRLVNGFEYIGKNYKSQILIFRCTHWNSETKVCDSYNTRPGMCRDYPRNLIYSTNPIFLDECSYYAIDKNADRLGAALGELHLSPKKLEMLKRKLHISDWKSQNPNVADHCKRDIF